MQNVSRSGDTADWALGGKGPEGLDDPDFDRPLPTKKGVLTAAEIEALLRPNLPDDLSEPDAPPVDIRPRLPEQFQPAPQDDKASALRQQAALFAPRLALAMGQHLGVKAAVGLRDCAAKSGAFSPTELAQSIHVVACFGRANGSVQTLIGLSAQLADTVIARACGSQESAGRIGDAWTLSAIDCALLEQLLAPLSGLLDEGVSLLSIETDRGYVASLLPPEQRLSADYVVEATGLRGELSVVTCVEEVAAPVAVAQDKAPITAIVTARVASLTVPMSRLTQLKAGSTLLLGLAPQQPVEVLSGGRDGVVICDGDIGRKGNKIAVRVKRTNRAGMRQIS